MPTGCWTVRASCPFKHGGTYASGSDSTSWTKVMWLWTAYLGCSFSLTCILQVTSATVIFVSGRHSKKRRSGCPVSVSLDLIGDRWSLLIVRDLMVRGYRTFKDFQGSGEGIATNILADRLQKLRASGIITAEGEEADGRKVNYRLTEKGIDLAPVLLELLLWGARHEETGAPCGVIAQMAQNRAAVLAEVRRRWEERDATPFLPKFEKTKSGGSA